MNIIMRVKADFKIPGVGAGVCRSQASEQGLRQDGLKMESAYLCLLPPTKTGLGKCHDGILSGTKRSGE